MLTVPAVSWLAATGGSVADEQTRFFLALVLLVGAAHLLGTAFSRLGLPRVIGEIAGGLLLGPTLLGQLAPDQARWIFQGFDAEPKLLAAMSWLGLVLLMFVSGMEVRARFEASERKLLVPLLVGATTLPFLAGMLAPVFFDFGSYLGPHGSTASLVIVVGIAAAITSIPVISKIFLDLGIMNTRFARIVLTVATVEDIALWGLLAVATGLAQAQSPSVLEVARIPVVTIAFFALVMVALPRLMLAALRTRARGIVEHRPTRFALFACLSLAAASSLAGVNVMFGALLAGMAITQLPGELVREIRMRVKGMAMLFFVPLYFAMVGLKLDLVRQFDPLFFLGFLAFCTVVKSLGTAVAARLATRDWLSTVNLSAALNARGGPGIVLATVALEAQIIDERFFVTLVLVAVVTSLAAGTWFRFVLSRGWDLLRVRGEEPAEPVDPALPEAPGAVEDRPGTGHLTTRS